MTDLPYLQSALASLAQEAALFRPDLPMPATMRSLARRLKIAAAEADSVAAAWEKAERAKADLPPVRCRCGGLCDSGRPCPMMEGGR